jgi:hypothetical protein
MVKRDGFGESSASKLTPAPNFNQSKNRVLDWLTATGEEEKCVNLLKEMELAQEEEEFFYMDPDESPE